MSRLFDSDDFLMASRTDHSLGSLPDSEIFDLLEEFPPSAVTERLCVAGHGYL